jgi:hypothetical protein
MATYTMVTPAVPAAVTEAVRAGRTGGLVIPGRTGTTVLFDAPPGPRPGARRLSRPAHAVACVTGRPAWVLLELPGVALAVLVTPERKGGDYLRWDTDWHPAEHEDSRALWQEYCGELSTAYGAPHLGPDLAAVRPGGAGGGAAGLAGLLRQVCRVFDLPETGVGPLEPLGPPGIGGGVRVEAEGRGGAFAAWWAVTASVSPPPGPPTGPVRRG